jgi:integrase
LVRVRGEGLVRVPNRKGNTGGLLLRVPEWSVAMLRRRKLAAGGGPLFASWNGAWLDPSNVIHRIREAFAECGYGWVTSHVFRKTVASVLDDADCSERGVSRGTGRHDRGAVSMIQSGGFVEGDPVQQVQEPCIHGP